MTRKSGQKKFHDRVNFQRKFHDPENYPKKIHDPEICRKTIHDPGNHLQPRVTVKSDHSLNGN